MVAACGATCRARRGANGAYMQLSTSRAGEGRQLLMEYERKKNRTFVYVKTMDVYQQRGHGRMRVT